LNKLQKRFTKEIKEVVNVCHKLSELQYVSSHGGNLAYKIDDSHILITPTKVCKGDIEFDDILIIDPEGKVLSATNNRKPTGEAFMYLRFFMKRPDLKGLIHSHPPILTGFALTDDNTLELPLLPETLLEVGPILTVEYTEPVSMELAKAFDKVIDKSNAFLMKNHGVMIGNFSGPKRALELLQMIELQAYSVLVAKTIGEINTIPKNEIINLQKTLLSRNLPIPGNPLKIKRLSQLFSK
jgi:L-fuculose-phosphate aldolase